MLRAFLIGRDERQIDARLHDRRKLDLRLFGGFGEPLHRLLVFAQVDALIAAELIDEPLDDAMIVIVAAEVRVAVGRLDFEDAVADLEDRNVIRAAAEIPDENRFVALLFEPVGERRRRRLVDDAQHVEAGDLAGIFRRLALRIVEIGGHGDDRFGHALAEIVARVVDELLQDHRRDLLRRVILAVDLDVIIGFAHVPLDRADRAIRIGDRLTLRELADETFAGFRKCHDRRRRTRAFGVGDNDGLRALHYGDDRVGRAEVDADRFCHETYTSFSLELSDRSGPAMPKMRAAEVRSRTPDLRRRLAAYEQAGLEYRTIILDGGRSCFATQDTRRAPRLQGPSFRRKTALRAARL